MIAFDTATQVCAVGLGRWATSPHDPAVLGESNVAVPRAALTHIVPMVVRLLEECQVGIQDVDAVVVGRGPGSFTGVRIGVATAKGLAQGRGVPLRGVGTLDAIAERFAGREGLVGVVGDAMRHEVYPALFRCTRGALERLEPDSVCRPDELAERWSSSLSGPVLLAGDGLHKYADVLTGALGDRAELAPASMWYPTGSSLLQAAWRAGTRGRDGSPASVLPIYTRLSDAEEAESARAARAATLDDSGVVGPGPGSVGT